jgi:glutathione peroxidase
MMNIVFGILSYILTSFYSLSFQDVNGNTINMSSFQGKKILISNVATGSAKAIQLAGLQQLQQQFSDSLVVIVFPSNSFGNENRSNAEIKEFCDTTYNNTFIIAAKSNVSGTNVNPVFNWLAHKTQNGEMDGATQADFVKFLISKEGMLIGMFSSKIKPTDESLINAITTSF